MVVGSTEHMVGIDAAPFLRYLGRFVPINALVTSNRASFRMVGDWKQPRNPAPWMLDSLQPLLRLAVQEPASRRSMAISSKPTSGPE